MPSSSKKTFQVMGILNLTPDSFYDGGRYFDACKNTPKNAIEHVAALIEEGMDILDVGGESTRPGAASISAAEEIERIIPLIQRVHREFPNLKISVDTQKHEVAAVALDCGATILNDVGGLREEGMLQLLQRYQDCRAVVMHMRGTPQTMQREPVYENVVNDLKNYFQAPAGRVARSRQGF
jgi:dihydropteroate synthase